jgi:hypothetical protein
MQIEGSHKAEGAKRPDTRRSRLNRSHVYGLPFTGDLLATDCLLRDSLIADCGLPGDLQKKRLVPSGQDAPDKQITAS